MSVSDIVRFAQCWNMALCWLGGSSSAVCGIVKLESSCTLVLDVHNIPTRLLTKLQDSSFLLETSRQWEAAVKVDLPRPPPYLSVDCSGQSRWSSVSLPPEPRSSCLKSCPGSEIWDCETASERRGGCGSLQPVWSECLLAPPANRGNQPADSQPETVAASHCKRVLYLGS